jgi:hypothetical protein
MFISIMSRTLDNLQKTNAGTRSFKVVQYKIDSNKVFTSTVVWHVIYDILLSLSQLWQ